MTTEIQIQSEIKLQVFEQMMDEEADFDLYDDQSDNEIPTNSEEEVAELERDLVEIALQTHNKKYTFVRLSPAKHR